MVIGTGMNTEIGHVAGLLDRTGDQQTPLQRELGRSGRWLSALVLVIAAVMSLTIVLVDGVRDVAGLMDVLILGVALAVAAVPEGLPAVTSAVLAVGSGRMARKNAIVRRLPAIETLGAVSVIASDKTGTLTRNEMTVREIVTASGVAKVSGSGYAPQGTVTVRRGALPAAQRAEVERLLLGAALANNATLQEEGGAGWSSATPPRVRCSRRRGRRTLAPRGYATFHGWASFPSPPGADG